MHFLDPYINIIDKDCISVSAKQGCNFAKNIAGDFNPIHDSDSKDSVCLVILYFLRL